MGKERRDYPAIAKAVLKELSEPTTVNEIAARVGAGWTTVDRSLRFLASLGYVEKIVARPRIYKRRQQIGLSDDFINDLAIIIRQKGSRYHNIKDCVDEAIRDFIRKEKEIKRY
jgi:predicted transcriptional regulator